MFIDKNSLEDARQNPGSRFTRILGFLAIGLFAALAACSSDEDSQTKGLFGAFNKSSSISCGANQDIRLKINGTEYEPKSQLLGEGVTGRVYPLEPVQGPSKKASGQKVLKVYQASDKNHAESIGQVEVNISKYFSRFAVKTEYFGVVEQHSQTLGLIVKDRVNGPTLRYFYYNLSEFNPSLKEAAKMHSEFVSFKKTLAKQMLEVYKQHHLFLDDLHALNIMWDLDKKKWFIIDGFLQKSRQNLVSGFRHDDWSGQINEKWFLDFIDTYRDLGKYEERLSEIVKDLEVSSGF